MPAIQEHRIALRLSEVGARLGLSISTLKRARAAGKFPPPDSIIGVTELWNVATIERFVGSQNFGQQKATR